MSNNMNVVETRNVYKIYNPGEAGEVKAVAGIDLKVKKGGFISIMGPSGSGKTTLLDLIGCLSKPTIGKVFVDGVEINGLSDNELARIRGEKIGFIFQQYNLIPTFTAAENVAFSLRIMGAGKKESMNKAVKLLKLVGLGERVNHRPPHLSGGEQQRVAIARALANDPEIILGDEPTGNLDTKTGMKILELLKYLNKEKGYTIIVVTHDHRIGKYARKIINLKDGKIFKEK